MPETHPDRLPSLVYANHKGEIIDFPELVMSGRSGRTSVRPALADLIPLPEGSDLFVLPHRTPIGIDPVSGDFHRLPDDPLDPGHQARAVAAFMAPAHTATLLAGFQKERPDTKPLPLFAYAAVGWHQGRFWAAGFRSDPDPRQEPGRWPGNRIKANTRKALARQPENRLIQHLGTCCLTYNCPAAVNYFMGKWEAPLPTSPHCNARCIGCISLQPSGCCPSTQERISFVPRPDEIAGVAVPHLNTVTGGIVSFGQGCEGEPLLQAGTIEKAIRLIRGQTRRGTINLNSNASLPEAIDRLAHAGLDSIRVSMNSARELFHRRYYRPQGFQFDKVMESIAIMKKHGRFVSLNYFILPGFTDEPDEFAALCEVLETYQPDFIQLRNLNMDPDWYLEALEWPDVRGGGMGVRNWLNQLKRRFPRLRFGYFNPPLNTP